MKLTQIEVEPRLGLLEPLPDSDRKIGQLLIESGRLVYEEAERIARLQREKGLRFGEAAIQLGLLTQADIERALARQFDHPHLQPGEGGFSPELIAAYQPFSRPVEDLRTIRTQLMLRHFGKGARALAIVSCGRKEGRSYVAANLAVAFSQLGKETLLLDCDLRGPRQHKIFGLDNRTGLSTVLAGRVDSDEVIQRLPQFAGLSVMPAGPLPPNPHELLERPGFAKLVAAVGRAFDVVLLDTPAACDYADAESVSAITRGAMILTRQDSTRLKDARRTTSRLRDAGVEVVGVMINAF
jgi:receptor protein-tyrosine kinase